MGLLDKLERKGTVSDEDKHLKVDIETIRKHIEKSIKKQETNKVEEPTFHYINHKLHTFRPEGTLEELKEQFTKPEEQLSKKPEMQVPKKAEEETVKPGKMDISSIKADIEANLSKKTAEKIAIAPNRVSTGIPGLDEVMSGGFRKNTVNLVAGGPGSGKTIFAMQFLVNGIEQCNEPGVFVSFEQSEEEILTDLNEFGWDLEDKLKKKQLVILSYTPEQVENVLKSGGGTVRDVIDSMGARRVVIDSLTAFTLLHENALAQRKACLDLFKSIKKWNCTALLLAEHEGNPELHSPTVEEFEVDGVLLIYNIRRGDMRGRALEIFKMRGTKHSAKIFPMTIDENGITIYPEETVF